MDPVCGTASRRCRQRFPERLGFRRKSHPAQSLVFLNVPAMQQPEAYVANVVALHDENGALIQESSRDFFVSF
jgi:chromate reductase